MALQTGQWNINANGFEGTLNISSVDAEGQLTGTVFGDAIQGFWDDTEQKVVFLREGNNLSQTQVFTGFRFGPEDTHTVAGYFAAFSGTGGFAERNLFGWFARTTQNG
jgi:hypothetical protein